VLVPVTSKVDPTFNWALASTLPVKVLVPVTSILEVDFKGFEIFTSCAISTVPVAVVLTVKLFPNLMFVAVASASLILKLLPKLITSAIISILSAFSKI
jgi:hypothetical protein